MTLKLYIIPVIIQSMSSINGKLFVYIISVNLEVRSVTQDYWLSIYQNFNFKTSTPCIISYFSLRVFQTFILSALYGDLGPK